MNAAQTRFWIFRVTLMAIALTTGWRLEAAVYNVGSVADLTTRIGSANPGDQIILSNGVYTTTTGINITRSGTAAQPILIAAQTVGGAEITGTSAFNLAGGDYVIIQGFYFTHTNDSLNVYNTSTHCRITRNIFEMDTAYLWLKIEGDDTEVDHNIFRNKTTQGRYLVLGAPDLNIAQRLWVHHNGFYNHSYSGGNGGENTKLGDGDFMLIPAWAVVENNLYDQANGDPEIISIKSSDNVIRYNTATNSTGMFVVRQGCRQRIEGNFFFNSGGIRFYNDDNLIFNNYLQGAIDGIEFGSGDWPQISDAEQSYTNIGTHAAAHRARVVFNTMVNCQTYFNESPYAYIPTDIVVANNILQGSTGTFVSPALASGQTNFTWKTNIFWGGASTVGSPAGGYQQIDPKLATNTAIPYRIASNSPAINAAYTALLAEVVTDMDGQPRSGIPDIGADEYSSASIVHRPLNTNDVGPYVVATNFDIVATPWGQTVMPGRGTSYTILLSAYNGFTDTVTLSVTNLPAGASASFSASSISNGAGYSTLSVTTSNSTPPSRYTLFITASSSSFTNITTASLIVGDLPANWTDADINSPGTAGSADLFMNSFTVKGGGANIAGTSDQFNYVYQPGTNGLTVITARVSTQPNTSTNARSGVMIRESTNSNSRYAAVFVTPINIKMDARTTTGGSAVNLTTFSTNSPVGTNSPCWVRLVFSGSAFTGYASTNGENWVQMGVTNVSMTNPLVGLAVSAGNNAKQNISTFDNVGVESILIISQPADQSVAPGNAATFTVGALGGTPLGYRWFFNVTNAVGSNSNVLTLTNVQATNAGNYLVVVTNTYGAAVTSSVATLVVSGIRTNTYTAIGSTNWICPAGVTSVRVECWGGGGAGGSAKNPTGPTQCGGGGAGGAYARYNSYPVTPGNTYYINVGTGGINNASINDTTVPGGDSWFNTNNAPSSIIIAKGGAGGESAVGTNDATRYGTGGTGTTNGSAGNVVYKGGNGGTPSSANFGGSGGGSGGTSTNGNSGAATSGIGATAVTGGGNGGNANAVTNVAGPGQTPTIPPGGGGGGGRASSDALQAGGTGAAGQVVLIYTVNIEQSYTLTANAGTNGIISPASTNVLAGNSATFVVTASNFYRIASLKTNNADVIGMSFDNNSTSTNFIWSNVQTSGVLAATFTAQVVTNAADTPYEWLAGYGLTNYDTDAVADSDFDGLLTWQEYIAGTVPTNAASVFKAVQNNRNVITWTAQSNRIYSVYWSTNLVRGFTNLNNNILYPTNSFTNATPDSRVNHYQIKVRLQ